MPAAIPYIASAAATAAGATAVQAAIITLVASVAVANSQRLSAKARAQAAAEKAARDRTITVRSGLATCKLVLGTARLSGPLMHADYVGTDKQWWDTVIAFTRHRIEVQAIHLDDEPIPVAALGGGEFPTTGRYGSSTKLRPRESFHSNVTAAGSVTLPYAPAAGTTPLVMVADSTASDANVAPVAVASVVGLVVNFTAPVTGYVSVQYTADPTVDAVVRFKWNEGTAAQASLQFGDVSSPKWTADHRLRGVSHLRALMKIENRAFAPGVPNVSIVAKGPIGAVWDPRTSTTVHHTTNPALLAAWFRTLPEADGGLGIPSAWIDWASVSEAANECDELITVRTLDGAGYETVKRYECNTVLSLDQPPADNLQVILDAMAGAFPFTGGLYRCYAGAFRTAAFTFTDADISAGETFGLVRAASEGEPPNVVSAKFYDAAQNWAETAAPPVANAAYITADGGESAVEVDLQATTDARQANYLQGVLLERARPTRQLRCTLAGIGANVALLDTFQLNLPGYASLAGVTFEVQRRVNRFTGRYDIEAREVRASTYALDADRFTPLEPQAAASNTHLWQVASITGLAATTATPQVQSDGTRLNAATVTWAQHPAANVAQGGAILLRWRRAVGEWFQVSPLPGDAVQYELGGLPANQAIFIEAAARNSLGVQGEWVGITHTVVGKVAAFVAVTGFSGGGGAGVARFTWATVTNTEYRRTQLRVGADWATGTPLDSIAGSGWAWVNVAAGSYTVWARHEDFSGNLSAAAVSATVTVTAPGTGGGGGNVTFEQEAEPTGGVAGDLWRVPSTRALYRYDGAAWVAWSIATPWGDVTAKPADTDLLNTHTANGITVVNHPAGGALSLNVPGQVGALKIALPQSWTATMLRFFVEVYEYNADRSFTVEVGGYTDSGSGGQWTSVYAKMTGSAAAQKVVRFGHDGTKCCVWIGEPTTVWEYPKVTISNLRAGYSNFSAAQWQSGWALSLDTTAHSGHAITATVAEPLTGATWANTTGAAKPEDNATVGAQTGVNLKDGAGATLNDTQVKNQNTVWADLIGKPNVPQEYANRLAIGTASSGGQQVALTYGQEGVTALLHPLIAGPGVSLDVHSSGKGIVIGAGTEVDHIALSADSAVTGLTLADTPGMQFTLQAGGVYAIEFDLPYSSNATTAGLKIGYRFSSGGSGTVYSVRRDQTSASASETRLQNVASTAVAAANTVYVSRGVFVVVMGLTSGVFQLQHASEVAGQIATLKAGAGMVLRRYTRLTSAATLTLQTNPGLAASYTSSEETLDTGSAHAGLQVAVKADGTWAVTAGGGDTLTGTPTTGNWGTPTTADVGLKHEARFTQGSTIGAPSVTNQASDWTPVATDKVFAVAVAVAGYNQVATAAVALTLEVRLIGTTTPVSTDTLTFNLQAQASQSTTPP